ncbi:MAG: hypothetical protein GXP38_13010, partial [Chloroflexi bacterium]|nr:hypothetical protein [Chloroflexota bacterium]
MKNKHQTVHLSFAFVVGFALLAFLAWSLTACQASGQETLPRLLTVIEMPNDIGGGTARGITHPSGWAYIINDAGSIAVLDGPRLVKLLPLPSGGPKGWTSLDVAVDHETGRVYVSDRVMGTLYVISGTQFIETIPEVGIRPKRVVIHPKTGYVYVANNNTPGEKGTVAVISGTTVLTRIPVGYVPQTLVVNPVDGLVYVGQTRPSSDKQAKMLAIIKGTELVTQTNLELDISAWVT